VHSFVTNRTLTLCTFILYQNAGNILLTFCSTVLLEKLTFPHLVKKFAAFYETGRLIMHSQQTATFPYLMPPLHPTFWRSILILSSYVRVGVTCGPFPSGLPTKPICTSPLPDTCYMNRPLHSWFGHPEIILYNGTRFIKFIVISKKLINRMAPNGAPRLL